ncbi:unnamed protein product, partial [Staurois parvus]
MAVFSPCKAKQGENRGTSISKNSTHYTFTQHTINPLIAPDVNPFLPSVISTVSVLFISTDHCISVIEMSVAVSQFPPSVRMPAAVP